jgi:hypothetical protein
MLISYWMYFLNKIIQGLSQSVNNTIVILIDIPFRGKLY